MYIVHQCALVHIAMQNEDSFLNIFPDSVGVFFVVVSNLLRHILEGLNSEPIMLKQGSSARR